MENRTRTDVTPLVEDNSRMEYGTLPDSAISAHDHVRVKGDSPFDHALGPHHAEGADRGSRIYLRRVVDDRRRVHSGGGQCLGME